MSRTLLVSNRLPITLELDGKDIHVKASAGGLATALRSVHAGGDALWIGWPGDLSTADADTRANVEEKLTEARLVPVDLTPEQVEGYYYGFSNGAVWPLCHYLLDKVDLDSTANFKTYRRVNELFADAIARVWSPDDLVWIHDYQLLLVPALLRDRCPDATIGYFHHIPFPSGEVFRILPWREELIRGLLGADLVGFHTASYAFNFAYAASQIIGLDPTLDLLRHEGRSIRVGAYPIGIDAEDFSSRAKSPAVEAEARRIRESAAGKKIVLGIDRLDYTKGIPRRLMAFAHLLDREPALRDTLHYIQLAMPTREKVEAYVEYRRTVNELVGSINGKHGSPTSAPVHLLHQTVGPDELSALYRAADVMLVTPLRDGMNLVAKEYVASRVEDDGVLVLSEFAGAATELHESLQVNPYDIEAVANVIARALKMPLDEQRLRMRALKSRVAKADVSRWARTFLEHLETTAGPVSRRFPPTRSSDDLGARIAKLSEERRLTLILDYDGTLVPFASMPDLAIPDPDLLELLDALGRRRGTAVHIVSGRSHESLERWFADQPVALHAEHGFWSRTDRARGWTAASQSSLDWKTAVRDVLTDITARTDGSLVEEKAAAIAWHYRATEPQLALLRVAEARSRLSAIANERGDIELLEGAKVLETRLKGMNKGVVVNAILASEPDSAVMVIGDDRTDEDMFAVLPPSALTIKVGAGATIAQHRVTSPTEVRRILRSLVAPRSGS